MDPEQLLANAQAALARGASPEQVNARLASISDFTSIEQLQQAVAAGPPPEAEGGEQDRGVIDALIGGIGRGLTGGFLDELTGLALSSDIGATLLGRPDLKGLSREEAIALARGSQEELADEHPIASTAGLLTGAIAGPGALATRAVGIGRRGAGLGQIGRLAPQSIRGRAAVGAGQLGAVGAGEAGLFAAGEAEGGVGERVEAAGRAAPAGAALGVATGGLLGAAGGARAVRQSATEVGEELAEAARTRSGLRADPRPTKARAAQLREEAQETFAALEAQGRNIPAELTQQALDNPTIRRELGKLRSVDARRVLRSFEKFEAGEANSVIGLSFRQADDIAKNLRQRASFFAQNAAESGGIRSSTPGRVDLVREAEEAVDALDTIMNESLEGFAEARALWSQQASELRALTEGRRLWGKASVDIIEAADDITEPHVLQAFREGLATELVRKLESGAGGIENFIRQAETGSELQRKLAVVMGSPERAAGFLDDLAAQGRLLSRARLIETITKWAGFAFGGSSLAGGAALTVF